MCVIPDRWQDLYDFMKSPSRFVREEQSVPLSELAQGDAYPSDGLLTWEPKKDNVIEIKVRSTSDRRFHQRFFLHLDSSTKISRRIVRRR